MLILSHCHARCISHAVLQQYRRALRGHFIVDSALKALLLAEAEAYNFPLSLVDDGDEDNNNSELPENLSGVKNLLLKLLIGEDFQLGALDG